MTESEYKYMSKVITSCKTVEQLDLAVEWIGKLLKRKKGI